MLTPDQVLASIPSGLRDPLFEEYNTIVQNFLEQRWSPSELSGGKFSEIVYTILEGYPSGSFASSPQKPQNFVSACRSLEISITNPRSFKILIPRMLPALYEIRNNRGVGHVGGDVDPNHMDAMAVLSMSSWVLAEMVRVFHNVGVEEAQKVVDSITERRVPLVWHQGGMKRVLDPTLLLKDQILLLLSSVPSIVNTEELFTWIGCKSRSYFYKILRKLHSARFVELNEKDKMIQILPPGLHHVTKIVKGMVT